MTRHEFISNEHLCKQLFDILSNPVMMEAVSIVSGEMQPGYPVHHDGDLIQQAAVAGMRAHGAHMFLMRLRTLTNPAKPKAEVTGEFDHAAIDYMVKSGYTREQAMEAMKEANQ